MSKPTFLDLKVPPALVVLLVGGGMWGSARAFPRLAFDLPMAVTLGLGVGFGAAGVGLALAGVATFRRHGTTVDPLHPEAAGQVVRSGPFRRTRNPMYLGMALLLLGWAVGLAHPLAFLGVPALMAYLTRFQIQPEERALRAKFGAPYEVYLREVRRWV
ncbi:MAG TPA: isoprenylcysteine carboxylmethyltransferase family protein [Holophagaceae bacterium]|nr:isoprenylcysteine carboxylmethyltransferase family protein [Holophagaceae bacterium]